MTFPKTDEPSPVPRNVCWMIGTLMRNIFWQKKNYLHFYSSYTTIMPWPWKTTFYANFKTGYVHLGDCIKKHLFTFHFVVVSHNEKTFSHTKTLAFKILLLKLGFMSGVSGVPENLFLFLWRTFFCCSSLKVVYSLLKWWTSGLLEPSLVLESDS